MVAFMKALTVGLLLLCFVGTASALDKPDLDLRLQKLISKFELLQLKPDKAIPAETLRKAKGILLLDRTKAGLVFGFQGGSGVAMVRDAETGNWSAPGWVGAGEASFGLQIGGQQSFFVILLMNTNSTRMLLESSMEFGGEAGATVSSKSSAVEGAVTSHEPAVLVYVDRKGIYGGATVKAGVLAPDSSANSICYGKPFTMSEILFEKKAQPNETAKKLISKVAEHTKVAQQ
jgi:lipid-binding SYLF domain-containing protein